MDNISFVLLLSHFVQVLSELFRIHLHTQKYLRQYYWYSLLSMFELFSLCNMPAIPSFSKAPKISLAWNELSQVISLTVFIWFWYYNSFEDFLNSLRKIVPGIVYLKVFSSSVRSSTFPITLQRLSLKWHHLIPFAWLFCARYLITCESILTLKHVCKLWGSL